MQYDDDEPFRDANFIKNVPQKFSKVHFINIISILVFHSI
jgi:hypothetical protein